MNRQTAEPAEALVEYIAQALGVDVRSMGHLPELTQYVEARDRTVASGGDPVLIRTIVQAQGFGRCGREFKATIERPNDVPTVVEATCAYNDPEGDQRYRTQCPNCERERMQAQQRLQSLATQRATMR